MTLTHFCRPFSSDSLCLGLVAELWSALRLGMIGCSAASGTFHCWVLPSRKEIEYDSSWLDACPSDNSGWVWVNWQDTDAGVVREDRQAFIRTDWREGRAAYSPVIVAFGLASLFARPCRSLNHISNIMWKKGTGVLWLSLIFAHSIYWTEWVFLWPSPKS